LEGKSQGDIYVSCEHREKRVYLTISDNGLGIDPAIEDKIFLPFFTTRKEGAGIGLTLSKNIVEAHGGYLAFESTPEKTSFTVCLLE
jgi:signal transduction histidine kinase